MCEREEKDTRDQRIFEEDVGKMEGKGMVLESTIQECEIRVRGNGVPQQIRGPCSSPRVSGGKNKTRHKNKTC